jgi:hypothetical protein
MITNKSSVDKNWKASDLRKKSPAERDAILAAAAARAESEYRTNPHLTDFEAFGEDDLYGECSGAKAG